MNLTLKEAWELVGGLSEPSKMPCFGYSTPAKRCQTGMKLRAVVGTICAKCYALKGNYMFPKVQESLERRFASLSNPLWIEAMAFLINGKEKSGFFRWHDSGDVQSVAHLKAICRVAELTPTITHWLPTREYGFVGEFVRSGGTFPANLTVRLSALKIDGPAPVLLAKNLGVTVSGVKVEGFNCPASNQGNKCLDCRACWDKNTFRVDYKKH